MLFFALLAAVTAATAKGTQGISRVDCLDFGELKNIPIVGDLFADDLCIGYTLNTCGKSQDDFTIEVNVTYGKELLADADIDDYMKNSSCIDDNFLGGALANTLNCKTCFSFPPEDIIIKPAYARVCPKITEECSLLNVPIVTPIPVDCVEIGGDCSTSTDCEACGSRPGCAWCEADSRCAYAIGDMPYCDDCPQTSPMYFTLEQCPSYQKAQADAAAAAAAAEEAQKSKKKKNSAILTVVLVILIIALLGALFLWYRRRQNKGLERPSHTGFAQPVELDDDEGMVMGDYGDTPGVTIHTDDVDVTA